MEQIEVKAVQNGFIFTRGNGAQFTVAADPFPSLKIQRAIDQFADIVQLGETFKGLKVGQKLKITFATEEVVG